MSEHKKRKRYFISVSRDIFDKVVVIQQQQQLATHSAVVEKFLDTEEKGLN